MANLLSIAKFICKRLAFRDAAFRFFALTELGRILRPDYRFKWPQMDWWGDSLFNQYLDKFGERGGMNTDRRWMVYQLLRLVDSVPGDTAECGVFAGAGSYLICLANSKARTSGKCHHLFDSFAGLSRPCELDGDHWSQGDLACGLEIVRENLSGFRDVQYHPGWIPRRFCEVERVSFSFVHIDVDLYQPTLDSLAFFYPRMVDHGVVVVDDYGFTSCPGATEAVDEYLHDKPEQMLRLSGGGGFFIKGRSASRQEDGVRRAA